MVEMYAVLQSSASLVISWTIHTIRVGNVRYILEMIL